MVTSVPLIDEVFSKHELFTATSLTIPKIDEPIRLIPNHYDPPEHTPYRKVMANNLFSPRALKTLLEDTRQYTMALFEGFAPGRCEFVKDFAYRLLIDIFLNLMGANAQYREECLGYIYGIFRGATPADNIAGHEGMVRFVTRWLTEQLEHPERNTGQMFRQMVKSRIEGRALTYEEMHAMTLMLFSGGLDTITSQMTHIMQFFAENPEHRQHLVDHPEDIPAAMEELLRRFGISFIGRAVAKDITFHGVAMKQGEPVCAGTPIAGLDPRAFPDPLTVDFGRGGKKRVKHLGFGAGPHQCAGAHLARTQIAVMMAELLPRMPGLHIAKGAEVRNSPGSTMMLKTLPLEWGA